MSAYFKRQLADYVEYHRDPRNSAMHVFGILFLFLAAVLPLSLWPVHAFRWEINLAAIMVLPGLIYWLLLDLGIGAAIVVAAFALLSISAVIVSFASTAGVWAISALLMLFGIAFQIVGHRVFEGRQPALLDNPAHLLLGPMFVMAKLFIALGYRDDLAAIIDGEPPLRGSPACSDDRQGSSRPTRITRP
jgi:uncharacterized membrane protein YGL010W